MWGERPARTLPWPKLDPHAPPPVGRQHPANPLQPQLLIVYPHDQLAVFVIRDQATKYSAGADQWSPRGAVLRCLVEDDENGQLVVGIDDQELSLEEFGRMLTTYAGWGMRIEFVPDDQLHRRPALEVREPDPENESAEG